jgi:CRP-like cAMP-binding protein
METLQPILAQHPFFQGLSAGDLQLLAGCASNVRYAAGDYLFHEGAQAHSFWLIREGTVALETPGAHERSIPIETIESGEVLGWSWLFPPYQWHFSARAVQPVRALTLDGACLRARCDADPRLGYELMRRFAQVIIARLQATRMQLLDVYGKPARGGV